MPQFNWIGLYTFTEREVRRMFRVVVQTLLTPWISALLYIFIFGAVVGQRISEIQGVRYIDFVLPGLVMMNIISSAFAQTSSSVYFMRFVRYIEELLVAPLSYFEMIVAFSVGGVVRGIVVGVGVYVIALLFTVATIEHFFYFLFYSVAISLIFSFLGMIIGLWAKTFEQFTIFSTFVILPLTFLGGVFNSITMLPPVMQTITRFNPFFYFVDGLRFSMIGIAESHFVGGLIMIVGLVFGLGFFTWYLFKVGYGIKD